MAGLIAGKPFGFGDNEQSIVNKKSRRELFLIEMETLVPWQPQIDLIEPCFPQIGSKGGPQPFPLETLLLKHQ